MQYNPWLHPFPIRQLNLAALQAAFPPDQLPWVLLALLTLLTYRKTYHQHIKFAFYIQELQGLEPKSEQPGLPHSLTRYAVDCEVDPGVTIEALALSLQSACQAQGGETIAIDLAEQNGFDRPLDRSAEATTDAPLFTVVFTAAGDPDIVAQLLHQCQQEGGDFACAIAGSHPNLTCHLLEASRPIYAPLETYLETLVQSCLDRPHQPLHAYSIVSAAEQEQQDRWGQGSLVSLVFNGDQSRLMPPVYRTIEELASQFPDHPATSAGEEGYTYGELNQAANRLARLLQALTVKPGDRIVTFLPRSIEMLRSILAIHKAGAVYVPVDPTFPKERIRVILAEVQPKLIVTQAPVHADLDTFEIPYINLSTYGAILNTFPAENLDLTPTLDSPSHIFFTSGTTGKPKGVVATHRNLVQYLSSARDRYRFTAQDRFIAAARYTFSISFFELLLPLYVGAFVRIVPPSTVLDLKLLTQELENITVFHFGPSLLKLLLPYITEHYLDPQAFSHLRHVSSGGDMVPPEVLEQLKTVFPQAEVFVIYGSTEISCMGCTYAVPRDCKIERTKVGKPHQNMMLRILDDHHNRVPTGAVGQVYFSGAGVTQGYFNQPQLTAEKFITIEGRRFYSIGDLGRFDAEGNVELLGRNDFQVQVRGMRVELPAIEAHLKRFPGLRDCVVVSKSLPSLPEPVLVAYFTADSPQNGEQTLTGGQLRRYLVDLLPDYMIPQRFVRLEALPTNLNGKLDRSALPDLDSPQPTPDRPATDHGPSLVPAPAGDRVSSVDDSQGDDRSPNLADLEATIAALWSQILGQPHLGLHDNFFELGGHSLLATRISVALQQRLNLEVPLAALFDTPTVAGLAQQLAPRLANLEGESQESRPFAARVVQPHNPSAPYPLSVTQEGIWFFQQLNPSSSTYNIPLLLHLSGPLNLEALQSSLEALRERHSILRTRIIYQDNGYYQIVSDAPLCLEIVNCPYSLTATARPDWPLLLQQGSTNPRLQQILSRLDQEIHTPFPAEHSSLMRAVVLALQPDHHLLLITLHHAISDEWSLGLLQGDLSHLYQQCCQGRTPSLPSLPLQYAQLAQWQQEFLASAAFQDQLSYWTAQLQDLPPLLELPTDYARPAQRSTQGQMIYFQLEGELVSQLRRLSQHQGVSLFMVLMAAFQVLLQRYAQQEDFAVGFPIAHRNEPELTDLIGCCIHTLVLRARVEETLSFQELLLAVRQATLEAYAHQDVPLEKVLQSLGVERHTGYTPLFQVLFAFQNTPSAGRDWGELSVTSSILGTDTAKFDLSLYLFDSQAESAVSPAGNAAPESLSGCWEYRTDLFRAETMERMIGHFQELLWSIVQDCQQPLYRLNLLSRAERDFLLSAAAASAPSVPAVPVEEILPWVQTFEAQVERSPQAIAVIYQNQQITYAQLNTRANHLARRLLALGMEPETLVGLCVERTPEMLVALIAVWKAGGAYIPLDPVYPKARIDYVLNQSQVSILLTQTRLAERVAQTQAQIVLLDAEDPTPLAPLAPLPNLPVLAQPHQLAYILYTSGSTGQPKGVQITHRAVSNFLESMVQTPGLSPQDRVLAITTIAFDIAVLELFGPLSVGGTVVLAPQAVINDGYQLAQTVKEQGITLLQATPSTWRMLLAGGWPGSPDLKMLCGGEPLSRELADRLLSKGGTLWNLYGPTETTVWSSVGQVQGDGEAITLGHPIANTQLYVLDAHHQLLPRSVPGELYIGGAGLARGYLHRPDLTAERFIADPFSEEAGACLYRTGDRVRYRPDGQLEFLGRVDYQVKIRGFRIELGEIEAVLRQHPHLAEVVVIDREDRPGDKRLVAYVTLKDGVEAPNLTDLRQFIQLQLPSYMLPSAFVVLSALPLTPNGKVDRRALPKPEQSILQSTQDFVAPRTPLETQLAEVWAQVLEQDQVGLHDNFFELGGHSILAIQLAKEMNVVLQPWQKSVSLMQLFQHPTLSELCALFNQTVAESQVLSAIVPLLSEGSQPPCFVINSTSQAKILSQLVQVDRPFYSLNMFCVRSLFDELLAEAGQTGQPTAFIPEIAAKFLLDLKQIQPQGPYSLVGYCQDGPLTLELAQQLRQNGDEVAHLCLIDSPFQRHLPRFQHRLYSLSQMGLPYIFDSLQRFAKRYFAQNNQQGYRKAIEELSAQARLDQLGETPKDQLFYALYLAEGIRYQPQLYDRTLTILLSSEWRFADLSVLHKINPGRLATVPLRTPHTSLFREPYVRELAIALAQVLQLDS